MNDLSENLNLQQQLSDNPTGADPTGADQPADDPHARHTIWFFVIIALVVVGWGTSVALFGLPGLIMPALAAVPVIFVLLLAISWN